MRAVWRSRPLWLLAGLAIGVAGVLYLQGDEPPAQADRATASTDVPPELASELARAFRPRLLFDTSERWRPLELRRFLAEQPRHRLCLRAGGCEPIADLEAFAEKVSDAGAFGDESYLDIAGDGERPSAFRSPTGTECAAAPPLLDCDTGPSTAIYYRVSWANNRYYIDYWWFLRFNDNAPDSYDHEGDWEGVTAVTAPGSRDTLDYVSFASHEGRFRYTATELERAPDGRPYVYVANGSHAAYAHKCDRPHFLCQQLVRYKRLAQIPERRFDGARPWGRNDDADCFPEARPEDNCLRELARVDLSRPLRSWTIWGGLWGASCGKRCDRSGTDSPRSPGRQDRYSSPWCSVSVRGRQCDSTPLGCDAWLGPLVSVAVCVPPASAESRATTAEPVVTVDGQPSSYSATAGVLQVLGAPLTRAQSVTLAGVARKGVQVVVRASNAGATGRVVEARFDGAELTAEPVDLVIEDGDSHPRVLLRPSGGDAVEPVDVRTFRPPGSA